MQKFPSNEIPIPTLPTPKSLNSSTDYFIHRPKNLTPQRVQDSLSDIIGMIGLSTGTQYIAVISAD